MGYRSDVCFVISKKNFFAAVVLESTFPKIFNDPNIFSKTEVQMGGEPVIFFKCDGIKWYPSTDSEVEDAVNYIEGLDEEVTPFGFLRIGEELEDIESMGIPWDFDMYVHREITVPVGNY